MSHRAKRPFVRRRGSRDTRSLPGPFKRVVACLLVAAVTLISPLESGLLPTRLAEIAEPSRAQAQTATGTRAEGTPDPCPSEMIGGFSWKAVNLEKWNEDPSQTNQPTDVSELSECLLEVPACPESEVSPGTLMGLSVPSEDSKTRFNITVLFAAPPDKYLYPEFCEERFISSPQFDKCEIATGYVVQVYDSGRICRLIHPIECPTGTHRSGAQKCRAVQRRDWTCGTGEQKANQFNQCYRPSTHDANAVHPACVTGAPEFPLGPSPDFIRTIPPPRGTASQQACAEYVGEDYTDSLNCASDFPIKGSDDTINLPSGATLRSASSAFWCQYNTMMLNLDCHLNSGQPSECSTPVDALCLKRLSQAGGCDLIVQTIRCLAYQADFAEGSAEFQAVRDAGCEPCNTLPFEAPASGCPLYQSSRPRVGNNIDPYGIIFAAKRSLSISANACRYEGGTPSFADRFRPNQLRSGQQTLPNTCTDLPVCADPPSGRLEWSSAHASGRAVVNSRVILSITDIPLVTESQPLIGYNPKSGADPSGILSKNSVSIQFYSDGDGRVRAKLFNELADKAYSNVGDTDNDPTDDDGMVTSECTLREEPRFNIIIQELWPDQDEAEIKKLFGDDALEWWTDLSSDENGTIEEKRKASTEARGITWLESSATADDQKKRRAELTNEIQCYVQQSHRTCAWQPTRSGYYKLIGAGVWMSTFIRSRHWALFQGNHFANFNTLTKADIQKLLDDTGLTAEQVGLDSDNMLLESFLDDPNWLYSSEADVSFTNCSPAVDLRVRCIGGSQRGNYTETEPIGIMVHEVRVNTITPD